MKYTQSVFASMALLLTLLVPLTRYGFAQIAVPEPTNPNIVFIMVDDGRYDEYRPTGAPSWFELVGSGTAI